MPAGKFAKSLQLRHELQNDFLIKVVSLGFLRLMIGVETQFEANDTLYDWFGVNGDQLREEFVDLFVAGLDEERFQQNIDLNRRLVRHRFELRLIGAGGRKQKQQK